MSVPANSSAVAYVCRKLYSVLVSPTVLVISPASRTSRAKIPFKRFGRIHAANLNYDGPTTVHAVDYQAPQKSVNLSETQCMGKAGVSLLNLGVGVGWGQEVGFTDSRGSDIALSLGLISSSRDRFLSQSCPTNMQ